MHQKPGLLLWLFNKIYRGLTGIIPDIPARPVKLGFLVRWRRSDLIVWIAGGPPDRVKAGVTA